MKVEGLFPTPVYCNTINNPDVTKELDECYSSIDFRYYDKFKETHKLSPDPFDNNVITYYNLENFWKELDFNVNQYCTNVFNIEDYRYKITNSWFSQFDKGDYGHTHNHGSTDLSGVYYCKTNGKDGNIFFECPIEGMHSSHLFHKHIRRWEYEPAVGKLILFPGFLRHGIFKNTTNNNRVSLSFNISFIPFRWGLDEV